MKSLLNEFNEILLEEIIMEGFSEMGAAPAIAKWLKKTNTVVVNQDFTNNFINTKTPEYADYRTLVKWCTENNVVLVNKKFWDQVRDNISFKI